MALRSTASRATLNSFMAGTGRTPRYFTDSTGRILNEEERAAENIYIKKMEKERLEKKKMQEEKEKASGKESAEKKSGEGSQKS